jgi:hypothetical protein
MVAEVVQVTSRAFIAETFLRLLRDDKDKSVATEAYYVRTAAGYGVTVERIAELSGIPLNRVAVLMEG